MWTFKELYVFDVWESNLSQVVMNRNCRKCVLVYHTNN